MNKIPDILSSGGYNYPAEPRQEVLELLKLLKPHSEILDIGAGFGNNCLPLLEGGHIVTVTETNTEALIHLRNMQREFPEHLTVLESPAQQLQAAPAYDGIICAMVLQFLPALEARRALDTIRLATKPGGYNVVINYLAGQDLPREYTYVYEDNELKLIYADWKIITYEESFPALPQGQKAYKSAKLLAQKGVMGL